MKKIIIGIIIGMLISSVAYAAVSLSSDKVGYNDKTVKDSLDNLFDESVSGKNSIIAALSNKGFNVNNNSTYSEIVNGINELPVTIAKDEEGNYGYINEGEESINLFNKEKNWTLVITLTTQNRLVRSDGYTYTDSWFYPAHTITIKNVDGNITATNSSTNTTKAIYSGVTGSNATNWVPTQYSVPYSITIVSFTYDD